MSIVHILTTEVFLLNRNDIVSHGVSLLGVCVLSNIQLLHELGCIKRCAKEIEESKKRNIHRSNPDREISPFFGSAITAKFL